MSFGKHHNVRLDLLQFSTRVFPEVRGYFTSNVASKSVEIKLADPMLEHVSHITSQLLVAVIQSRDIVPIERIGDVALRIPLIKLRMLHQHAVPRRVIRDDVDDDFQTT